MNTHIRFDQGSRSKFAAIFVFCLMSVHFSQAKAGAAMCADFFGAGSGAHVNAQVKLFGGRMTFTGLKIEDHGYLLDGNKTIENVKLEQVLKPAQGVGRLLVFVPANGAIEMRTGLWKTVMKFPQFFARFEMYADNDRLVIPDDVRLSSLNPGWAKFRAVPANERQLYSTEVFINYFRKNMILLATQGPTGEHDHLQEHVIGALVAPDWVSRKVKEHANFHDDFAQSKNIGESSDRFRAVLSRFANTAADWDGTSNTIGSGASRLNVVEGMVTKASFESLHQALRRANIHYSLVDVDAADHLTPDQLYYELSGSNTMLAREISELKKSKVTTSLLQDLKDSQARTLSATLPEEKVLEDALHIAHELTGVPLEDLRQAMMAN
jgi:hypothetical protein